MAEVILLLGAAVVLMPVRVCLLVPGPGVGGRLARAEGVLGGRAWPGVATLVPIRALSLLAAGPPALMGVAPGCWPPNLVTLSLTRPWIWVRILTMEERPHCGASA